MALNPKLLPPNMLRCMSAADREPLGKAGQTAAEAFALSDIANERELQDQIAQFLRMKGVQAVFSSRMDRRTTNKVGQPDFLFCYQGCSIGLEAKMPGRGPTEEQAEMHRRMVLDGWTVAVVRGLEDVRELLRRVEGGQKPRVQT